MIFAFSAINLDGVNVMVLVDWDELTDPLSQAIVEHYDKQICRQLTYVPVWAKDALQVSEKWKCLKAHVAFDMVLPFVKDETKIRSYKHFPVAWILESHNPFEAFAFVWGRVTPEVVKQYISTKTFAVTPENFEPGNNVYNTARIAYLVVHPASDPIDVYRAKNGKLFVENGNHRLAAAVVREDKQIAVRLMGFWK